MSVATVTGSGCFAWMFLACRPPVVALRLIRGDMAASSIGRVPSVSM